MVNARMPEKSQSFLVYVAQPRFLQEMLIPFINARFARIDIGDDEN